MTTSPPIPYVVASIAQLAELEAHGRDALRRFGPAQLAAALYAAVYVEQLEGRLAGIDLDTLEDLAALIQRAEHDDEQARAG
jgi:hypothetical protein